jgi:DNA-directed RNA polymerase specialized sigma24 family protein
MARTRRKGAQPPSHDERPAGRRRGGPLRDQYPTIFAFGEAPIAYLSIEEAQAATPAERIKSVWPFLVRSTLKFCDTLRRRAAINFDPEDVLTELYIVLAEKDAKWEPARGTYLAFAGRVVANALHQIRDRAGTIHGPRNAACRVKQYERERAEGTLTAKKAATLRDIRRAFADHDSLDPGAAEQIVAGRIGPEEVSPAVDLKAVRRIKSAVMALPPTEGAVISRAFGLFDGQARDIIAISEFLGISVEAAKRAKAHALRRLRSILDVAV